MYDEKFISNKQIEDIITNEESAIKVINTSYLYDLN